MALSGADRTKLARILGMLGSDHVGERAAAGAAAQTAKLRQIADSLLARGFE